MYKDFTAAEPCQNEIEDELCKLERSASIIFDKILKEYGRSQRDVHLSRKEYYDLRKFLFIMMYRNKTFHTHFTDSVDEYNLNDRDQMLAYMKAKGFENPDEVWFSNIRGFLFVDLTKHPREWKVELEKSVYPPDALWFYKNVEFCFVSTCTPTDVTDEFMMTQNAFSICFQVYCQIVLHYVHPSAFVQMQQDLSSYRIRLMTFSYEYPFESILRYYYAFMTARMLYGQDDPTAWATEDHRCAHLLLAGLLLMISQTPGHRSGFTDHTTRSGLNVSSTPTMIAFGPPINEAQGVIASHTPHQQPPSSQSENIAPRSMVPRYLSPRGHRHAPFPQRWCWRLSPRTSSLIGAISSQYEGLIHVGDLRRRSRRLCLFRPRRMVIQRIVGKGIKECFLQSSPVRAFSLSMGGMVAERRA